MAQTARFALPLLHAGQAQKEMSHNEALTLLDALTQSCVVEVGGNAPPVDPVPGDCWIVGSVPSGDWAEHPGAMAMWTGGGWRFVAPRVGMAVWSIMDEAFARYDGTAWQAGTVAAHRVVIDGEQVVGAREPAIAEPDGGSVVDVEAREAIEALIAALRAHGLIDAG